MNTSTCHSAAAATHWIGKISPTLFVILSHIYWKATSSPDGKVGQSIEEIADATGLSRRTVGPGIHELDALGAIQILSAGKERMLIEIPRQYWLPPPKSSIPDVVPTTIPELIHRLCGQRASPEMFALMKTAAGDDEQRLQYCLDTFLLQGRQWETLELLAVAVQDDLKTRGYFDPYWDRA